MLSLLLSLAAPAPAPLTPTKPWVVDYSETYCAAVRAFGTAEAPLDLVLRPSPEGDVLQLFVLKSGGYALAQHVPVTVGFAGAAVKATALEYGVSKGGRRTILISLANDTLGDLPKARTLTFHGSGIDYDFALTGMGQVLAALSTCNDDLRRHWNMTDEAKAAIRTEAKPVYKLWQVLSDSDYPDQALREEDAGKASVLLMVDETGKVADCLLQHTSGNASLDAQTCIAFRNRARFKPALDAAGKPLRSVYHQAVSWRIQG
jgi:TonB family protein